MSAWRRRGWALSDPLKDTYPHNESGGHAVPKMLHGREGRKGEVHASSIAVDAADVGSGFEGRRPEAQGVFSAPLAVCPSVAPLTSSIQAPGARPGPPRATRSDGGASMARTEGVARALPRLCGPDLCRRRPERRTPRGSSYVPAQAPLRAGASRLAYPSLSLPPATPGASRRN